MTLRSTKLRLRRDSPPAGIPHTEARSRASLGLDQLSAREILRRMNREDATVAAAVRREIPAIARAVEGIVSRIARGGRLIYIGAGSSGRLGVLDAAECPPTFGISPKTVRAVIAGGNRALRSAVEGAEDSAKMGARDIAALRVTSRDAVVGIAASGATPYVLGAIRRARSRRSLTIALTANPDSPVARAADIAISPRTGAELIAGSTRLKAGTAQKLVLNMLSTAVMVRLGRVYDNLMIHVAQTNRKLKRRAIAILRQASGASPAAAARAVRNARGNTRVALLMLTAGANRQNAELRLKSAGNDLRAALGQSRGRNSVKR